MSTNFKKGLYDLISYTLLPVAEVAILATLFWLSSI
jgi:hypothetical protein